MIWLIVAVLWLLLGVIVGVAVGRVVRLNDDPPRDEHGRRIVSGRRWM